MPEPAPPQFQAKSAGRYPLRGGPLCGLWTDLLPWEQDHADDPDRPWSLGLVWYDSGGREWLCVYRFLPDWPGYEYVGKRYCE